MTSSDARGADWRRGEPASSVLRSTEPILLWSGGSTLGGGSTEGPVWHVDGSMTFVRFRQDQLLRRQLDGEVTIVRQGTGRGNGCTLDVTGRLLMCEGDHRRVTRIEADGSLSVVAERFGGRRLNMPNDVVTRSDGSVYFTDPGMKVAPGERDLDFSGVFRLTPDGDLALGTDACAYPNGLAFSPDETVLYVADSRKDQHCLEETDGGGTCRHRLVRAFDVSPSGELSNARIFASMASSEPGVPDGVKVDLEGRVYCAGSGGIWVFGPDGERLEIIRLPEKARNLCFGEEDRHALFVTAGDSLYRLETIVPGIAAVDRLDGCTVPT